MLFQEILHHVLYLISFEWHHIQGNFCKIEIKLELVMLKLISRENARAADAVM